MKTKVRHDFAVELCRFGHYIKSLNCVLFLIAVSAVIYCSDFPLPEVFSWAESIYCNDHNSLRYALNLSYLASYIFFLLTVALPQYSRRKRLEPMAFIQLQEMCNYMKLLLNQVDKNVDKSIEELYENGSRTLVILNKELTVMEALLYYSEKVGTIATELSEYGIFDGKENILLVKIRHSILHKLIEKLYGQRTGIFQHAQTTGSPLHDEGCFTRFTDDLNNLREYSKEYASMRCEIQELGDKTYSHIGKRRIRKYALDAARTLECYES